MFANGLGDWGSIPGWVIPKTQKMELDAALLNTQHYKVRIKVKAATCVQGMMAIKGCSALPKAPALLKLHHQIF